MEEKNVLNVLNGQAMLDYIIQNHLDENGVFISFNEAMCVGEAANELFSKEFIDCRCKAHNVTNEFYNELTLKPLEVLFTNQFQNIILWFDDDMFCQINLLTLLAYLDQINYCGKITFNLVDRNFKLVNSYELQAQGYKEIYKQVMVDGCFPHNIKLPVMENGIRLYFEYLKEENEITAFIRQHDKLRSEVLLTELLKEFTHYGLGDTQYIQLIKRCRKDYKFDIGLINFKSFNTHDFDYMYKWLNSDFVSEWYGKKSWTYEEIEEKYIPYTNNDKPIQSYLVLYAEMPIGYIQTYKIHDYPDYALLVNIDENAAGLDLFIGEKEYLNKGFGKYIISKFLKEVVFSLSDAESCIIGPEPKNIRAIKTYEKVGFRHIKTVQMDEAGEFEYIMRIGRNEIKDKLIE